MHERNAAEINGGGETRKVADHSTAERDHYIVALQPVLSEEGDDAFERSKRFMALAVADEEMLDSEAGASQTVASASFPYKSKTVLLEMTATVRAVWPELSRTAGPRSPSNPAPIRMS